MFYDEAKIYVKSGDGGDGMISFRREKYVPFGGPDGGDAGRGGNVVFVVNPRLNSLAPFHGKVHFKADNGVNGGRKKQSGAVGKDMRIEVPRGTVIRDAETGDLLADLVSEEQEVVFLEGGRGGRGNVRFANSIDKAPRIAERGEPGREMWVRLELKLIADVGLVGKPNAGKSTLLSVISAAKPKIAAYPFTTLQPNLGVVQVDEYASLVFADIPGLIEGAAKGVGLGHAFLRHIERTRVIVHLIDGSTSDPLEDWATINQELAMYGAGLDEKPQLVVLNKLDLPDAVAWEPILEEEIIKRGYQFQAISAVTGLGVRDLLFKVSEMVAEAPDVLPEINEEIVIRAQEDPSAFTLERMPDGFRVHGEYIERVAAMTYWEFDATVQRFQRILESSGVSEALLEAGVKGGDMVYIGEVALEWQSEEWEV